MWNVLLISLTDLTNFLLVVIVLKIYFAFIRESDRNVLASIDVSSSDELLRTTSCFFNCFLEGVVDVVDTFFSLFCDV